MFLNMLNLTFSTSHLESERAQEASNFTQICLQPQSLYGINGTKIIFVGALLNLLLNIQFSVISEQSDSIVHQRRSHCERRPCIRRRYLH